MQSTKSVLVTTATSALVLVVAGMAAAADGVSLAPARIEPLGVEVAEVEYGGKAALHVTGKAAGAAERLAVVPGPAFGDGTIEVDLAGAPAADASREARGFLGIAFRVQEDRSRYECFYFGRRMAARMTSSAGTTPPSTSPTRTSPGTACGRRPRGRTSRTWTSCRGSGRRSGSWWPARTPGSTSTAPTSPR